MSEDDALTSTEIKYIDIAEFRKVGFLQEVNRRFLHPLGLALEVVIDEDGTERLSGIWDYRNDPEGIEYDSSVLDWEKAKRVADERVKHDEVRRARFHSPGYIHEGWIQPIIPWPTECSETHHIGPYEHVPGSDSASKCLACGVVSGK